MFFPKRKHVQIVQISPIPFCKTRFSTTEQFWQAKNFLLSSSENVHKTDRLESFVKNSHVILFFFSPDDYMLEAFLSEAGSFYKTCPLCLGCDCLSGVT